MAKGFNPAFLGSIASQRVEMFYLVAVYFDNKTERMTTLPGGVNITYQGETWEALDQFLNVGPVYESADITTQGFNVTLSGISNDYLDNATELYYQGRVVEWYAGLVAADGTITVQDELVSASVIDNMSISVGQSTFSISINTMPPIYKILDSLEERLTDEDQQAKFPGDTGLSRVSTMPNKQYSWGSFITSKNYIQNRY